MTRLNFEVVFCIGGFVSTINSLQFGSFGFFITNEGSDKRLCDRDEHVIVLSGAYLSSMRERTELNRWR